VVIAIIWFTIAVTKLQATLFVVIILAVGLVVREYTRRFQFFAPTPTAKPTPVTEAATATASEGATPPFIGDKILVAARGWTPALRFALDECRVRGSHLLVLFVREVAVNADMSADWEDDPDASRLFRRLDKEASHYRVHKLFSISDSPSETIIDIAATFGVDTVVLGGSKRARLVNLLKGNVITRVASSLPETMRLIVVG